MRFSRHLSFRILTAALFSTVLACTPKQATDVVRMGFTPAENTEKVSSNGKAIADILKKSTGYTFETFVASDYTALIEAMRSGQVDVAWLAPFAFVLAEKNAGAKVLLKSVRHGQAAQYSAIVVRENSPYKTIQDLKGKSIAWTDPSSSSGHITPKAALIAIGIDPDKFFDKQTFAGSHESLVMAVMNGSVEAGATFSDDAKGTSGSWTKFAKNADPKLPKLRAIYVTPPMPSDTISISAQFASQHPDRVEKIKVALKALSQSTEGKEALMNLYGIEGLVDANSSEFEPLRAAAAKLGYNLGGKK